MTDRGERLVYAMHLRGFYKQHALAHLLGVTESTITRWKNNRSITVEHAIEVCEALGISLDWFLCGLGPIERPVCAPDIDLGSALRRIGLEEEPASAWIVAPLAGDVARAWGVEAPRSALH